MRVFFFCVAVMACTVGPVLAQFQPETPQGAGIQSTITAQIEALRADDFARAFSYASPNIQTLFGTAENFGAMVRKGYPMVHHPSAVRMLGLREVAGNLWQRVMVTDETGATHLLDYQMVETPQGWQINAVQLLPQAGVGA